MFWGLIEPSVHKVIYRSRSEATERRSEAVNASHTVCICALKILRKKTNRKYMSNLFIVNWNYIKVSYARGTAYINISQAQLYDHLPDYFVGPPFCNQNSSNMSRHGLQ